MQSFRAIYVIDQAPLN